MNEWKELDPSNLPNDILVGDYEIKYDGNHTGWFSKCGIFDILENARDEVAHFVYRKREPETPSHTEIMTKWWKEDYGSWVKVYAYLPERYENDKIYGLLIRIDLESKMFRSYVSKQWFSGRESADIPPEKL